ncbi:MAG: hypothetical protein JWR68_2669, partial [Polaromonas sp.]|nr:hypothetical protein [Polaromonas sp.]
EGKPACRLDAANRIVNWVTSFIGAASPPMPAEQEGQAPEQPEPVLD